MGRVRILLYAINGIGLGHLTRLLAIARSLRELALALDVRVDLQFVTTSEGSDLVRDFPVYKIPSKTAVAASTSDRGAFVASAKLLISNVVAAFRPDILVLDTVPEGAFRELVFVRDFAQRTVFIDRLRKQEAAIDRKHQTHLALFDRILVPDDASEAAHYPLSPRLRTRRRFVGRVHGYRPEQAWTRDRVRSYFSVPSDRTLIYLSAGGGGDKAAGAELETVIRAIGSNPRRHLIVGYGPLHQGSKVYGERITPVVEPSIWRFFPGVDMAISAAGYNTYEELLAAGVPTVFYAQSKGLDAQDERVRQGAEAGWHRFVPRLEADLIEQEVERLEDPETGEAIRGALRARGHSDGVLHAAVELLALHANLPQSPIVRRQLLWCAASRAAWGTASRSASDTSFPETFHAMQTWFRTALDRGVWDERVDRAVGAWGGSRGAADAPDSSLLASWMTWASKLQRWRRVLAWPDDRWHRLVQGAARDTAGTPEGRASVLEELLEAVVEQDRAELGRELTRLIDSTRLQDMAATLRELARGLDPTELSGALNERDALASTQEAQPGYASSE